VLDGYDKLFKDGRRRSEVMEIFDSFAAAPRTVAKIFTLSPPEVRIPRHILPKCSESTTTVEMDGKNADEINR
jgi:hypothetical protein